MLRAWNKFQKKKSCIDATHCCSLMWSKSGLKINLNERKREKKRNKATKKPLTTFIHFGKKAAKTILFKTRICINVAFWIAITQYLFFFENGLLKSFVRSNFQNSYYHQASQNASKRRKNKRARKSSKKDRKLFVNQSSLSSGFRFCINKM